MWSIYSRETLKILPSFHKNGIINLTFSSDGALVASVGMDINFSIQITNWQTEEVVALRNSGSQHIFEVKFNPLSRYEFATCGLQNVTLWEIKGRNLLRSHSIALASSGGKS